jgi:uncharacterized membrane protein YkoI
MMMRTIVSTLLSPVLLAALLATGLAAAPALAQQHQRDDQDKVRKEMQQGNVRSLRQIEQSVLPRMKGAQYLGPEYDSAAMAYRLKFIKDGRVTFVDVDARTGRILGISR